MLTEAMIAEDTDLVARILDADQEPTEVQTADEFKAWLDTL